MSAEDITGLARAWAAGDAHAAEPLIRALYGQLRRMAGARLRGERAGHTLSPTALVHEVYLRLARQSLPSFSDRAHFLGVAAQVMRQVLIDHARRHRALKRGGPALRIDVEAWRGVSPGLMPDMVALDDALVALAAVDARKARAVELKYFGGLDVADMASLLQVSERTVKRDLQMAEAWLHREMRRGSSPSGHA